MTQAIYKFPESNRRLEKLISRVERIILTTISQQGLQGLLQKCSLTSIYISPDLSAAKIGLWGENDIESIVERLNNEKKLFNKALTQLGTKRTPKCFFYIDADHPKHLALQASLDKPNND